MTCAKEDGVPVDVVMHNGMIEARKKVDFACQLLPAPL